MSKIELTALEKSPAGKTTHKSVSINLPNGVGLAVVPIPGTTIMMGQFEVTHSQWEAVMGKKSPFFTDYGRPVTNVSWFDCRRFIEKLDELPASKQSGLTFRLPTEWEWELSCRAGAKGRYCRLADGTEITSRTLGKVAWFNRNSSEMTHSIAEKTSNAFGLYDMLGNVWEWTQSTQKTSEGECVVCRGGSFFSSSQDCSANSRLLIPSNYSDGEHGFRLVASAAESTAWTA